MAGTTAAKAEGAKKEGPKAVAPSLVRDELTLKFVGTATLVVGLVILVAAVIGIAALSILRFDVTPWLLIIPLALLVVAVGAGVNAHYRGVVDRILNPKPEPVRPPSPPPYAAPYVYPYPQYSQYPQYGTAPAMYPAAPPAQAPQAMPPGYPPAYAPIYPYGVAPQPQPQAVRSCYTCGRPIPQDSKFCPYCRRPYTS